MQTDVWCPNCEQMVAPKRSTPAIAWILGVTVIVGTMTLIGWHWLLAGVTGSIITGVITLVEMRSTCPICKSRNLEQEAPAH